MKQSFSAYQPHRRSRFTQIPAWMRVIGMLVCVFSIAPWCAVPAALPNATITQFPCAVATSDSLTASTPIPAAFPASDRPFELPLQHDPAGTSHTSHTLLMVSGQSLPSDLALIEQVGGLTTLQPVSAVAAVAVPPPRLLPANTRIVA